MKIYHGGLAYAHNYEESTLPFKIDCLFSYAHTKKFMFPAWAKGLFMDSGAFSALSLGKKLVVQEYCDFLEANADKISVAAGLDVIGDPEATFNNWMGMKELGFESIPTLHLGEPLKYLDCYQSNGADYIGIGGIAKANKGAQHVFISSIFEWAQKYPEIGFHGFGVTREELLRIYPWKSVDSTAVQIKAMNGIILTPYGNYNISEKSPQNQKQWMQGYKLETMKSYVASLGYNWDKALKSDRDGRFERIAISLTYFREFEDLKPVFKPSTKTLF